MDIVGISGSVRKGSYNKALLRAAIGLVPKDCRMELVSITNIPLYNGDREEAEGVPIVVEEIKNRVAKADGLLMSTPEYNNGIPGVLKNAIDWMSRPPKDIPRVFGNKPVAMMGASPGHMGTILSQAGWLPVLRVLGMRVFYGKNLYVSYAHKMFNDEGELLDEGVREQLEAFLHGFIEFINTCHL